MTTPALAPEIDQVVKRLTKRFPHAAVDHIQDTVREEYDALADSRIRIYVSNLMEHEARERLTEERATARP